MQNQHIANSTLDLIGKTPMIKMQFKQNNWELILKLEKFNPGQSMKDRMALNMIIEAEKSGQLKPGGVIVESSSGNTATGLAMIAAVKGYKFIAVVDHHAAKNKIDIIKAYGGEIVIVGEKFKENEVAVVERERVALEISQKFKNSFFVNQADNINNRNAYIDTLAIELLDSCNRIDEVFGSIGTGGSLCGTAIGLKKKGSQAKINAVEPVGSIIFGGTPHPYYQSGTGNPYGADIPSIINFSLIHEHFYVDDKEAFNTCRYFAKHYGLLVGGSSGGVLFAAVNEISKRSGAGTAVAILCDGGEKYLETIFNNNWMVERRLIDDNIGVKIERCLK